MAFKMNGFSGFTNREERKIRKAKKKIRKAGEVGPVTGSETGDTDLFPANKVGKQKAAARKLKKAGYTEEQIEVATGAAGYDKAIKWAAPEGGYKDTHDKSTKKTEGSTLRQELIRKFKKKK